MATRGPYFLCSRCRCWRFKQHLTTALFVQTSMINIMRLRPLIPRFTEWIRTRNMSNVPQKTQKLSKIHVQARAAVRLIPHARGQRKVLGIAGWTPYKERISNILSLDGQRVAPTYVHESSRRLINLRQYATAWMNTCSAPRSLW